MEEVLTQNQMFNLEKGEHEQLSYYEALKWLAKKYNIEIKERELTTEEKQASQD
jgi:hypothetical protein